MFSYIMMTACYIVIPWNHNDFHFLLENHDELDWYITSTLQQHAWLVVDMSLNMDTLSLYLDNQYFLYLLGCVLSTEATNIKLYNNENSDIK
jgi:hypothetical protein